MPRDEARAVEVAIAHLSARLMAEPHLHAEVQRARRQFFGSDKPTVIRGAQQAAEQRFAEWFALERESEVLGTAPIEVPRLVADTTGLAGSLMGVFLVAAADDDGVEARDLQDDELIDLGVPPKSLQQDDLLVGRLFPRADGRWMPSSAAAVFRPGLALAEAFRRDVARVELDRRLYQIEIEHLLLRRTDQTPSPTAAVLEPPVGGPVAHPVDHVPLERLEAELDALLQTTAGRHTATNVSEQLAACERPGVVMGPLLEELAFDTAVDLDRARRLMLQIWNAYHGTAEVPAADALPIQRAPGETLGEQLVRALDDGLRKKRSVDDLFAQLERMAGLEPGTADAGENPFDEENDEPDLANASDGQRLVGNGMTGDLDPLVQEYLWECGRDDDATARPLQLLVELQGNAAVPRTDLEEVTGHDLMRLLLHCYLGAAPTERAATVRAAWAEVQRFYAWAQQVQELDLAHVLQACRGGIVEQLDRLQAAGLGLSTEGTATGVPTILEVEDTGPAGIGVRSDESGHHWLTLAPATAALLRQGDLILGALEPLAKGSALCGLVVVLPTDARTLME